MMPQKSPVPGPSKKTEAKKKEKHKLSLSWKKRAKKIKLMREVSKQVNSSGGSGSKRNVETGKEAAKEVMKIAQEVGDTNVANFGPILKPVQTTGKAGDPKSILCAFFKQGNCGKGDQCNYSHDLTIERRPKKRTLDRDTNNREGGENALDDSETENMPEEIANKPVKDVNMKRPKTDEMKRELTVEPTVCEICEQIVVANHGQHHMIDHIKSNHGHMFGYMPPESEIVMEKKEQTYPSNKKTIKAEIQNLGIPNMGGIWIEHDEYFVSYDFVKMRPLVVVELLTPDSLKVIFNYQKKICPYLYDNNLPRNQPVVTQLRRSKSDVSHCASSANHRLSEDKNDESYKVRNLVRLSSAINKGILSSVENHCRLLGLNWWKTVVVTVPVYEESIPTLAGELPEPSHIGKFIILGDTEVQSFIIHNDPVMHPKKKNFVSVRSSLEDFNKLTRLQLETTLSLSWERKAWKCGECRFTADEAEDVKLHNCFAHLNSYCPVHRRRCKEKHKTFEQFLNHVKQYNKMMCTEPGCGASFYKVLDLNSHKKHVHSEALFACHFEGCKKKFKVKAVLIKHFLTHDKERPKYTCDLCGKVFTSACGLRKHSRTKHRRASTSSQNQISSTRYQRPKLQNPISEPEVSRVTVDPIADSETPVFPISSANINQPYMKLPKSVNFRYSGKVVKLSQDAEKLAGFYSKFIDHENTTKEKFNVNFFKDWKRSMTTKERELITDIKLCDFQEINNYYKMQSETEKACIARWSGKGGPTTTTGSSHQEGSSTYVSFRPGTPDQSGVTRTSASLIPR